MGTIKYALDVISYSRFRSAVVFVLVFVTTVCVFGTGLFTDNIRSGADKLNGTTNTDLYIVPQEYLDSTKDMLFKGKACTILFHEDELDGIKDIQGIDVSRQLYLETLEMSCCSSGGLQIVAYDPETDFSVKQWSAKAPDLKADEILAGSSSNFTVGESVNAFGRSFRVADILEETGMGYDSSLFLTYEAADSITSSAEYKYMFGQRDGLLSMMLVRQNAGSDISSLSEQINAALSGSELKVYAVDELTSGLRGNIRMLTGMVGVMDVFALIIASVSLFAMVTVTSQQRRKVAGSLLSVGASKGKILLMFLTEYLLLFAAGTVLGIAASLIFLLPLHDVLKTALDMPYKLISAGQAFGIAAKTLAINAGMLAAALSFTFITIMKQEPAMLTGENV